MRAVPVGPTYRVVKVAAGDALKMRQGPGSNYPVILNLAPGANGILLGSRRVTNGTTMWQEISFGGYSGWVNEIYLEPESTQP